MSLPGVPDGRRNRLDFNRECGLVDGRFARIVRPIRQGDIIKWTAVSSSLVHVHTGLVSEIVEIDGKKLEFADYAAMEMVHYMPISLMVSTYFNDIGVFRGGVS